jgi:hypothetical protein
MPGTRVVGPPAQLDGVVPAPGDGVALRLAPDELFVLGSFRAIPDPGITEAERGFVGWWLTPDELEAVAHHVEWPLPGKRPVLAQGLVAGVPARLWLSDDGRALLLVAAAYAHELEARLP